MYMPKARKKIPSHAVTLKIQLRFAPKIRLFDKRLSERCSKSFVFGQKEGDIVHGRGEDVEGHRKIETTISPGPTSP